MTRCSKLRACRAGGAIEARLSIRYSALNFQNPVAAGSLHALQWFKKNPRCTDLNRAREAIAERLDVSAASHRPGSSAKLCQFRIVDPLFGQAGNRRKLRQARHADLKLHLAVRILPYQERRTRRAEALHELQVRLELRDEGGGEIRDGRDAADGLVSAIARFVLTPRDLALARLHQLAQRGRAIT